MSRLKQDPRLGRTKKKTAFRIKGRNIFNGRTLRTRVRTKLDVTKIKATLSAHGINATRIRK